MPKPVIVEATDPILPCERCVSAQRHSFEGGRAVHPDKSETDDLQW